MSKEQSNFDLAIEVIGQAICDFNIEEETSIDAVNNLLDLTANGYVVIQWPESQELMEKEWFKEEAILDVESKFGNSAYFIPIKRIL
jgi:hypothetical protein